MLQRRSPMRRSRLNPVGKRGRANRQKARARRQVAKSAGWLVCEVGPLLVERGLTTAPCSGEITLCHSLKTEARMQLSGVEREVADNETCGGCRTHHFFVLDVQEPAVTTAIVRDAIARRV